ncbi:MAG TPA: NADPH-dependent F420 reductase [Deltaproteobacteria bacterium]|jgi:NADPH-dependent F420 reductase|nr:NADPH-dependent F420 reductase [Deltaproteobacteria bacterium]
MPEIKESTPDVPAALDISSIAVIGGTGGMGSALAWCWGRAGYKIFIGSRNAEKAELAAEKLNTTLGLNIASGLSNQEAASVVEIIVLTVPFANHEAIVDEIAEAAQGKIVVDTTVPLVPLKVSRVQLPEGGSVAKKTQERLGKNVRVVSAFQTIAAAELAKDKKLEDEVLVCGNNVEARTCVISLVEAAGLKGWHAGPIDNSVVSESLTPVLIFLNKRYQMEGSGIRIVGH